MRSDFGIPWVGPHLHQQEEFYFDVTVESDDVMGFAYCYARMAPSAAIFGGPYDSLPWKKRHAIRVDGQVVENKDNAPENFLILDRDKFVFRNFSINLSSIEGID